MSDISPGKSVQKIIRLSRADMSESKANALVHRELIIASLRIPVVDLSSLLHAPVFE